MIIVVCMGIMGLSFVLTAMTMIFTKVASFVNIIGYLLLFLSGSIIQIPHFLIYTNPLSYGVNYIALIVNHQVSLCRFAILLAICGGWLIGGYIIFRVTFNNSKQFKWTY